MEKAQRVDSAEFARELVNSLDSQAGSVFLHDLPVLAGLAEKEVLEKVAIALRRICLPAASLAGQEFVLDDDNFYEVSVGVDSHDRNQLGLSIRKRAITEPVVEPEPLEIQTPSSLKFQTAKIWLPENLLLHADDVMASTTAIVHGASVWYEGKMASAIRFAKDDMINSMYRLIRAQLPVGFPISHFWFTTITEDRGHYIFDPSVVEPGIKSSAQYAINLGVGPAELFAQFLNTAIPAQESFSLQAIQSGKCIDIDMRTARYKDNLTNTYRAELAVFGCDADCMYPICTDEDACLVAVFSADLKAELLPKLEASKADLTQRFKSARSRIKRLYSMVGRSPGIGDSAVTIARMAGAFVNEVLK